MWQNRIRKMMKRNGPDNKKGLLILLVFYYYSKKQPPYDSSSSASNLMAENSKTSAYYQTRILPLGRVFVLRGGLSYETFILQPQLWEPEIRFHSFKRVLD
ncbi:hypothetical protein C5167_015859 [Papaver somniferum]|uniref:Uncharacterized protein n=1 Tax=Papaver somniferum TaxID=3469 RepID=A0A4Y7JAN4_PAPSO|nr:hypothetical protein C5167_015859 [Papaver somniferum]